MSIKRKICSAFFALSALLFVACTGGNSMETENILQGNLTYSPGQPVAQTPVQVCKHTTPLCAEGVLAFDTTDAQGHFEVILPITGILDIVVNWQGETFFYTVTVAQANEVMDLGTVEVAPNNSGLSSAALSSELQSSSSSQQACVYTEGEPDGTLACPEQTYLTRAIGGRVWMRENLNVDVANASFCYDNSAENCDSYGRLYTWEGAMQACPAGWHVPTDVEFSSIEEAMGGLAVAGQKLKAIDTNWIDNLGSDSVGFSALPGGGWNGLQFSLLGDYAQFWTATAFDSTKAWGRSLHGSSTAVTRTYFAKSVGFSVRCVQDE